jgi:hypothetical protein
MSVTAPVTGARLLVFAPEDGVVVVAADDRDLAELTDERMDDLLHDSSLSEDLRSMWLDMDLGA